VKSFPLARDASVGINAAGNYPRNPIALQFTRMAKPCLAFAAVMTFVLSVVSICCQK